MVGRKRPDLVANNKARRVLFPSNETKRCSKCNEVKPRTAFGANKNTGDLLQSMCQKCARPYNRDYQRERLTEVKAKVFDKLGRVCVRCGFSDERALQIDHVLGNAREDNATHRGIRFYKKVLADTNSDYQTLCANCNWIKRHENQEGPKRYEASPSTN
jgi:protein-arginine kinase activator protein McsA